MRLGGRLAGAIEVLEDIEKRKRPVADALKDWGLAHRFAGSGDRSAIGNIVYDALRMKLSHAYLMDSDSASALGHAVMYRQWGFSPEKLAAELDGDKFAPEAPAEQLQAFASRRIEDAPAHVQGDIPEWVQASFEENFSDDWLEEAKALAGRPTLDLRANTLKASRAKVLKALERSGAEAATIARNGIRIPAGEGASRLPNVTAELSFQKGWFEVQDEGSQIVADLADYPLVLVPSMVRRVPPRAELDRLERMIRGTPVQVAPPIPFVGAIETRKRRMAITAEDPPPKALRIAAGAYREVAQFVREVAAA